MALPKIDHLTYAVELPSTGKQIKMRPFTVKEEKILLAATQAQTMESVISAIQQVINNCIVDGDIDVAKLAMFDIEYLFLCLRAQSVNNVIDVSVEDEGKTYKGQVNLNDVTVNRSDKHNAKIKLDDNVGVVMRYPNFELAKQVESLSESEQIFASIMFCIDKVFDQENIQSRDVDFTKEELEDFVMSLPAESFRKISEFFETMPSIVGSAVLQTDDGEQKTVELKGLNDFF